MDAFWDGAVRVAADRVARFKAEAAGHINLAETALVEEFYGVSDGGDGAVLETGLNDTIVFGGGFEHFPAFPDIVRAGLFDVDVFAGLTGPYRGNGVPVVGRGEDSRIYVFVIKRSAKVILGRGRKLLNFGYFFYAVCEEVFVDVDKRLDANVWDFGKAACKLGTAAANTYDGEVNAVIGADYAACGRGSNPRMVAGGEGVGGDNAGSKFCGVGEKFAA